jgi:predicted flap endonuclease-1-like 5' DNA nuclease
MKLITKLATGAALAAILSISTPAQAQGSGKTTPKSKVSAKAKARATPTKTKLPKAKDYDFTADEIDGDRALPNLDRILGIGDAKHKSLIRLREHFITEIIRSADML